MQYLKERVYPYVFGAIGAAIALMMVFGDAQKIVAEYSSVMLTFIALVALSFTFSLLKKVIKDPALYKIRTIHTSKRMFWRALYPMAFLADGILLNAYVESVLIKSLYFVIFLVIGVVLYYPFAKRRIELSYAMEEKLSKLHAMEKYLEFRQ